MLKKLFLLILLLTPMNSFADTINAKVLELQNGWDHISFEINNNRQQKKAIRDLSTVAINYSNQYPDSAEIKAWAGIIISTEAGFYRLNVVKALKTATLAKDILEEALLLDPNVINGGVYSSLGLLYNEVPGSPIGFGDKDLAKNFLTKALKISPNGMISNFFNGQYYFKKKKYSAALQYFKKAKQGSFQDNRELAKKGTIKEIAQWITKTNKKMN